MASAYGSPAREYSRGDKALTNQGDNEADENESMDPPPRHRTPLRHNGSRWLRLICNGVPAQIESIADEPYVCDHTVTFDVSQPTISHHLKGYARLGWSTPNGEVSGSGTGLDVMRSTRAPRRVPRHRAACRGRGRLRDRRADDQHGRRPGAAGTPSRPSAALQC
jgi:hypothetical protein